MVSGLNSWRGADESRFWVRFGALLESGDQVGLGPGRVVPSGLDRASLLRQRTLNPTVPSVSGVTTHLSEGVATRRCFPKRREREVNQVCWLLYRVAVFHVMVGGRWSAVAGAG
jgi:hypothetical protein